MAEQLQYKCPCCGGSIEFDPGSQNLKCPYCDTEFEPETLQAYDAQLHETAEDQNDWNAGEENQFTDAETVGMGVYSCRSCGGEIVTDQTTGATHCPWCGSPVVLMGQFTGKRKPDLVIPFKLDNKAAKEGLWKYLSGKKLLPKVFSNENHIDEIRGIYVPVWLFDTNAEGHMRFKCTRSRVWQDKNYIYTETQYYSVIRDGSMVFADIPVDGSTKMADDLMESIEPFDLSEAVDFQTAYLSGYLADTYDVSAEDSIARANQRVKETMEKDISDSLRHDYDSVAKESSSFHCHDGRVRYALYPVWVLHTSWKEKDYLFAMNGQTGKFVGNLPVDKMAVLKWFLLCSVGFSAAIFLLLLLLTYGPSLFFSGLGRLISSL
ncbi:MAG: hypothetical protein IKV57_00525 [Clostridia bacterium]|nr:hypothetical protein [Clostridia bacterium]